MASSSSSTGRLLLILAFAITLLVGLRLSGMGPWNTAAELGPEETQAAVTRGIEALPQAYRATEILRQLGAGPNERLGAIEAARDVRDGRVTTAVEEQFRYPYSTVRSAALQALPILDREQGLRLLVRALQDEDAAIREDAAFLLRAERDRRLIPAAIASLTDDNPKVTHLMLRLLHNATGQGSEVKMTASKKERDKAVSWWLGWWEKDASPWDESLAPDKLPALAPIAQGRTPEFDLRDLSGRRFTRSSLRGRPFLLNFWATWCPPCREELPALSRLREETGVDVLGLATDESLSDQALRAWCRQRGLRHAIGRSTHQMLGDFGGIHELPVTFLINGEGRIARVWEGPRDFRTFARAVQAVSKGR